MTTTTHPRQPAQPAIAIEQAGAAYGAHVALHGISFDVRTGETFGLMGLNGAGKTTLIKTLLGLMPLCAGRISLFGGAPGGAARSKIAYLPEKFEPPAFLSGLEFIRFSLALYRRPFSAAEVLEAADRVALSRDALSRRVGTYSKGMRQKTGLLGTWLTACPLLILDEPMTGLDPRARALVKDEIIACKNRGMTVFLSSHILADMDEICDRVGIIHDGRLVFTGTPAALRQQTQQDYLERAFLKIIDSREAKAA